MSVTSSCTIFTYPFNLISSFIVSTYILFILHITSFVDFTLDTPSFAIANVFSNAFSVVLFNAFSEAFFRASIFDAS